MASDADRHGSPPAPRHHSADRFLLPSEIRRQQRRERAANRATARAGRAVRRRVSELFSSGGPAFTALANAHAASTAGDTLIAIALANSLFFAVPSSEARGNVALYLLLTVAPFAVIGPLLGRVFDLPGVERRVLIGASLIRVIAAVFLVYLADSYWLFPLAFTLLVLSRVHGISRSALLPQALTNPIALVTANARLAQISVIGGAAAVPVGATLALVGPQAVLLAAAACFGVATWQSLVLRDVDDAGGSQTPAPAGPAPLPLHTRPPLTERFWHRGEVHEAPAAHEAEQLALEVGQGDATPAAGGHGAGGHGAGRHGAGGHGAGGHGAGGHGAGGHGAGGHGAGGHGAGGHGAGGHGAGGHGAGGHGYVEPGGMVQESLARGQRQLRLARLATAVVRLLNGFLVLILAFAFRDVDAPVADFGAVLGAAGAGYALAAVAAPRLERSLKEEPMVVAALAVEAAAAFIAGQFFSLAAAAFLSLAAGYAWGTAKFAFDGLLQGTVAPAERGRAFTSSETTFQLAWVLGAFIPTGLAVDVRIGLIFAGITALFAQTVYVSRLLQRAV